MRKALILLTALALGACANQNPNGIAAGPGGVGVDPNAQAGVVPGSPNDPASIPYFQQTVGDRVLFLVDQHTLTSEAQGVLFRQAAWLKANPGYSVRVEGHADEQGTREYNIGLSNRRAVSVREFLISQGIPASRIQTVGFGKERPIEICSEEACYAQNRRAVTVLAVGAGV